MPTHFMLLRYVLFNVVCFGLLASAYLQGWVAKIIKGDQTHLVFVIFGLFLVGLIVCGFRVSQVSRDLLQPASVIRRNNAAALEERLTTRIAPVRQISDTLIFLGLIGTVIGFIIALSGVNPETAVNVGSVVPMVAQLIEGMSVALYTTLAGAVLSVWLRANYRMLAGAAAEVIARALEKGREG